MSRPSFHRFPLLALVGGALVALSVSLTVGVAGAQARGARVLVLVPAGEPELARRLGPDARARATAELARQGLVASPGPAGCTDPDCAGALLEGGAADLALALALWGRGTRCERVAVTVIDARGGTHGSEVAVAGDDVRAAVEAAVRAALARVAQGGGTRLSVTGPPEGATITLDRIPWGTMPHEGVVTAGEHSLAVSAEGYETDRRTVVVGAEPLSIAVQLTPTTTQMASPAATQPPTSGTSTGGPDLALVGVGGALGAGGLAAVGAALYGLLAPETTPSGPELTYERTSVAGSAAWMGTGGALVVGGLVLVAVGLASGGGDGPARAAARTGIPAGLVISF
ncbi:MAG: hypothetical protein OHK0013_48600 [Sandaracinaceae bacterium]